MNTSKEILGRIKIAINHSIDSSEVYLHKPNFIGTNAYEYIRDCLDSGWVSSSGSWVTKFEKLISEFTGSKYVIAVSNGTVALRLALYLIGVKKNDEVLIPPLSFVATANAVSHLGAIPHFIDIESDTFGICPIALEERLDQIAFLKNGQVFNKVTGNRISAVLPVHVFGLPSKIEEIKLVCSKWQLPIVEDAAEALGSFIRKPGESTHCGCFGEIGTLSFNGNKIITTGGGGALLTNNKKLAELAKHLSTTAKVNHPWNFYHDKVAWNDRLPNINAALGASQIEHIREKLHSKRNLHKKYLKYFNDLKDIEIVKEFNQSLSNYWLVTMRLNVENPYELREKILKDSHDSRIFIRPCWNLLNELPMYSKVPSGELKEARNQSERLLNLPSSPQLNDS